jgi:hypothetical protein
VPKKHSASLADKVRAGAQEVLGSPEEQAARKRHKANEAALKREAELHHDLGSKAFQTTIAAERNRTGQIYAKATAWHQDAKPPIKKLPNGTEVYYRVVPEDEGYGHWSADSQRTRVQLLLKREGEKSDPSDLALTDQTALIAIEDLEEEIENGVVLKPAEADGQPEALKSDSEDFSLISRAVSVVEAGEEQRGHDYNRMLLAFADS